MQSTSIVFLVYPNVTQLDLTGPAQVLSRLGNATVDLVWKTTDPVPTDSGFALLPTKTLSEIASADILCVPGGFGCVDVMHDEGVLDWVRRIGESAQWVTSVCTGSRDFQTRSTRASLSRDRTCAGPVRSSWVTFG